MLSSYKITLILTLLLSSHIVRATVPHVFSSDTAAKASEVNENFDSIYNQAIENKLAIESLDKPYSTEQEKIDCTYDPAALQRAYKNKVTSDYLNFEITGNCYADLSTYKGESIAQKHGQTLFIDGVSTDNAKLLADPVTKSISIWGGFNGGLYLSNLTIGSGGVSVGFSRNSQGNLTNIKFEGDSNADGTAILVQASAQVYLSGVSINSFNTGIKIRGNSIVRVLNTYNTENILTPSISINNTNTGVHMDTGAAIRMFASEIEINATTALNMSGASVWDSYNSSKHQMSGNINIHDNSFANLGELTFTGNEIFVARSQLILNDSEIEVSKLKCSGLSQVKLDSVSDLLSQAPDSNCIDDAAANRLLNLLKN